MQKIPTLFLIVVIFLALAFPFGGHAQTLYFSSNSHGLTLESKKILDTLSMELRDGNPAEQIALIGHTDTDADEVHNRKLSLDRARDVRKYLHNLGVSNRINIEAKGESELINASHTPEEKKQNRRVEIIRGFSSDNDIYAECKTESQDFTFLPDQDTVLVCEQGTEITLSKGILSGVDSNLPIDVKVQEYYDKSKFVLANLTTRDIDNRLLESRGMIHIEVYQQEKKLEVKEGKFIGILFRDRIAGDKTEIFSGSIENDEVVWKQEQPLQNSVSIWSEWGHTYTGQDAKNYYWIWADSIDGKIQFIKKTEVATNFFTYDTTLTIDEMPALETELLPSSEEIRGNIEDISIVNDLILSSPKLGWINCDRFYQAKTPKVDLIVKYEGDFTPNVVLVFKEINSVLPYSYRENNYLVFRNVPVNMEVSLIGLYKKKEMDGVLFATKDARTSQKFFETLSFREVSNEELQQEMGKL